MTETSSAQSTSSRPHLTMATEAPGRDPRFDVLFEPVRIGPVVARNRFFQVPHCNGMGYRDVSSHAAMRAMKAEGGWAVVCTEQCEFHYTSDLTPYIEARLWDDADIPALALMAQRVHEHGALAGLELSNSGLNSPNHSSRVAPLGPSHLPVAWYDHDPVQARAMTKRDIANFRRWHRQGVNRAITAGFDLVYVYAAHALGCLHHFLSRQFNQRTDCYGGSIENRMRLLREVLEDSCEEADGKAAIGCRITADDLYGDEGVTRGEIEEVLGALGEIPDLWDFALGDWEVDSVTSRFGEEGHQEPHVRGFREFTSKPVVGVGRFTSPETMLRMVREGVIDFIGAARPSIADPYLPTKIEQGRMDDIRECIGCNICVSGDFTMSPIRCTQNPSMGEEWRRGWHPEVMRPRHADQRVLVAGAGPAGLEAAMSLGRRGYQVTVLEATRVLGGRVASEARLPGLAAWIRVIDYRLGQIDKLANVEIYRESPVEAEDVLEFGFDHVAVATGSEWRRDGAGRWHTHPISFGGLPVFTPDDLMAGKRPDAKRVAVFDDDHYYMGGVLGELLRREGYEVVLITSEPIVSRWTLNTLEQRNIQVQLMELGVELRCSTSVEGGDSGGLHLECTWTEKPSFLEVGAVVAVTARLPREALLLDLNSRHKEWPDQGLQSVRAIGDALAPATIASAVWEGRRFAEELECPTEDSDQTPYKREVVAISPHP